MGPYPVPGHHLGFIGQSEQGIFDGFQDAVGVSSGKVRPSDALIKKGVSRKENRFVEIVRIKTAASGGVPGSVERFQKTFQAVPEIEEHVLFEIVIDGIFGGGHLFSEKYSLLR